MNCTCSYDRSEFLTADKRLQSCRLDGVTLKNLHDVHQQLSTVPQGFPVLNSSKQSHKLVESSLTAQKWESGDKAMIKIMEDG